MVLLTGVGHTPCWDCRVYLYRFFDLCCLTHIPLVDASNALFWLSNDSCGDGRGGVELLLLDPSSLDDCGKPRLGVDCIGGIQMRNEDDDDFGVTVVEDGRDADLATVSACEIRIVGCCFGPCIGEGISGVGISAWGRLAFVRRACGDNSHCAAYWAGG